jgi:hypothetical protein
VKSLSAGTARRDQRNGALLNLFRCCDVAGSLLFEACFNDAITLSEAEHASKIQQSGIAGLNVNYQHTSPRVGMLFGPWYLDEFDNPTRKTRR